MPLPQVTNTLIRSEWITDILGLLLNVLYSIAIILAAITIAKWLQKRILRIAAHHPALDPTLFGFLGNLIKYLILAFAIIFVLNRFGIQTTSLVALIGAAGLAIGLALQGTLTNLAAGVMLILFRPFRVGDTIDAASQSGTVQEISLFSTELKTYDGIQIIVPNSNIWSSSITNYSANPVRMIDLTISVAYSADLKKASQILQDIADNEPRVLTDPAPFIKVKALADSSVDFYFRLWTLSADWGAVQCDVRERVKLAFDDAGIDIPFPTRSIMLEHISNDTKA